MHGSVNAEIMLIGTINTRMGRRLPVDAVMLSREQRGTEVRARVPHHHWREEYREQSITRKMQSDD